MMFWQYDMPTCGWWLCKSVNELTSSKVLGPFSKELAVLTGQVHDVHFPEGK